MNTTRFFFAQEKSYEKNKYIPLHNHNETEVILYMKANAVSYINSTKHAIHDGALAVINSNEDHDELHKDACRNVYVRFMFPGFEIPTGIYYPRNTMVFEHVLKQINRESKNPLFAYKSIIKLKIEELNILIMRELIAKKYDKNISDCCSFICENCNQPLDMKQVAEAYGFTYDNFRHCFKKVYGVSPNGFMILKRLHMSSEMLERTTKTCAEIAADCGFFDAAQFSRMFKKYFGISPVQFRKNT